MLIFRYQSTQPLQPKQTLNGLQPMAQQTGKPVSYKTTMPNAFAQQGTRQQNSVQPIPAYQLGTLSGSMESDRGKKLWNNGELDNTGGWSYGTYQIETQKSIRVIKKIS